MMPEYIFFRTSSNTSQYLLYHIKKIKKNNKKNQPQFIFLLDFVMPWCHWLTEPCLFSQQWTS